MSKNKEYFVLIDTNKDTDQLIGVIKKNDTNVELKMTLMQNGEVYDLSDASYITITVGKPDGSTNNGYAEIDDPSNGKVSYLMPINVTNLVGEYTAELQVYVDEESFSTATIAYTIKESLLSDEGVTQAENYPILTQLVADVTDLKTSYENIAANEDERISNEGDRVAAESTRVSSEETRGISEVTRVDNENTRILSESERIAAENIRLDNEVNRVDSEAIRKASETSRTNAESTRISNETTRVSNETLRVNSENTRESNEVVRVTAETNRVDEFNQMKEDYESAIASGSNLEVVTAREDLDGTVHDNLKKRIDSDAQKVKTIDDRLAQKGQVLLDPPLTTENPVQSVKDIEAGVASVVVPGLTLVNSTKKGDVHNTIVSDGTGRSIQINENGEWVLNSSFNPNNQYENVVAGEKYFLYGSVIEGTISDGWLVRYEDGTYDRVLSTGTFKDVGQIIVPTKTQKAHLMVRGGDAGNMTKGYQMLIHMNALGIVDYLNSIGLTSDVQQKAYMYALCRNGYFEGMQSRRGSLVKSVNKNLVDVKSAFLNHPSAKISNDGIIINLKNTAQVYYVNGGGINIPIFLESGKTYYFKRNIQNISGNPPFRITIVKSLEPFVQYISDDGSFTATSTGIAYLHLYQFEIGENTCRPILVEGNVEPDDIIHQHSDQQFQPLLGSVPNGERDEVDLFNGAMDVSTNVGRDGEPKNISGALTTYANGGGVNSDLSYARLDNYLTDAISATDLSGIGFDGENLYKITSSISLLGTERGFFISASGHLYYIAPTSELVSDDVDGIQADLDARQLKLTYQLSEPFQRDIEQVNPLSTYAGYTEFISDVGIIGPEKANAKLYQATSNYLINGGISTTDNALNPKLYKILKLIDNGRDVTNLFTITNDVGFSDAYGALISSADVEDNDIDILNLDIIYKTSETNGYKDVEVKYNIDLASAVSSNSQAISHIGEQVDKNTNASTNQNLINLEFDVRLTALEP